MGFYDENELIRRLEGGHVQGAQGLEPFEQAGGEWAKAFGSKDKARLASVAIANFVDRTQFDPQKNWVDLMRPFSDGGVISEVGADKDVWFTKGNTDVLSGDRALRLKSSGINPNQVGSPYFRVASGRTYKITVRWKAETLGHTLIIAAYGFRWNDTTKTWVTGANAG